MHSNFYLISKNQEMYDRAVEREPYRYVMFLISIRHKRCVKELLKECHMY